LNQGKRQVLFVDECHLLWGDVTGYVWAAAFGGKFSPETCLGKTNQRIEVPVVNERQRQTYFGALNYCTKEFVVKSYAQGNSESTIEFLQYLQQQYSQQRLALFWDGASYHRSAQLKAYLQAVNQDLVQDDWQIICTRFAPNAPEQNPVEDVWLQAKRFIRQCYHLCKSFAVVKFLFEFLTHRQVFDFPKLSIYDSSS
jgi:putative transposase